jgi:hypothetical protein
MHYSVLLTFILYKLARVVVVPQSLEDWSIARCVRVSDKRFQVLGCLVPMIFLFSLR